MGSVVTGRIPNGTIREIGLSGEAILVGETTFGDIEIEILRHPASTVDVADGISIVVAHICYSDITVRSLGLTVS